MISKAALKSVESFKRSGRARRSYVTARAFTDGMMAILAEPNGYLGKPFTDDQLVGAIARLLRPPEPLRNASDE